MGQSGPTGNGNETLWHEFETTKKKAIYLYDFQTEIMTCHFKRSNEIKVSITLYIYIYSIV